MRARAGTGGPRAGDSSSSQSSVGTEDGTSSTLTTPVAASSLQTWRPRRAPTERRSRLSLPPQVRACRRPRLQARNSEACNQARAKSGAGGARAVNCKFSSVPCRDRGRSVIDACRSRCGAPAAIALFWSQPRPSNLAAARRDADHAGLFRSGQKLPGDRGSDARNSEARDPARATTGAVGPRAGDCQFSSARCRDCGWNVIDARHPSCGVPIAIS